MLKSKLYLVLIAASLFLSLVLMLEWFYFRTEASDLKQRLESRQVGKTSHEAVQEDIKPLDIADYAQIVERPLFSEGRKPSETQSVTTDLMPVRTPMNFKLMGIAATPTEKLALFVDLQGKYWHIKTNGVVQGWKLVSIEKDKVILQQGSERNELKLDKPRSRQNPIPPKGLPPQAVNPQVQPHDIDEDEPLVPENNASDDEE